MGETYFGIGLLAAVGVAGNLLGWQRNGRRYAPTEAQDAQERDALAEACLQEDLDWSWTWHDSLFISARGAE